MIRIFFYLFIILQCFQNRLKNLLSIFWIHRKWQIDYPLESKNMRWGIHFCYLAFLISHISLDSIKYHNLLFHWWIFFSSLLFFLSRYQSLLELHMKKSFLNTLPLFLQKLTDEGGQGDINMSMKFFLFLNHNSLYLYLIIKIGYTYIFF